MVKVLYERIICNNEVPRRCRKTATIWVDGLGYCDDHEDRILPSLVRFKHRIEYR